MRCIKELRALNGERPFPVTLWRGMRNRNIADRYHSAGGEELAFMSTTSSLSREALLLIVVPTWPSAPTCCGCRHCGGVTGRPQRA